METPKKRKRGEDTVSFTFEVHRSTREKLDQAARRDFTTASAKARQFIARGLEAEAARG